VSATPTVSVIVPTYQRRESLREVIEPLLADPALHELVVAVDGSTDRTAEWLEQRRSGDPRLTVLRLDNRGVSAARQAGLEAATGDLVLFLDDDVVPVPGLVAGHARRHGPEERVLVQGYTPNDWRRLRRSRRAIARIYRRDYERVCVRYEQEPDHILLGFWGGNFSLRRADCQAIGIANPLFRRGAREEDREFGIRCFEAGLRAVFDRKLVGDHRYERDFGSFRRDCWESGRSRRLIHDLHPEVVGHDLTDRTGTANTLDRPGQRLPRPVRRVLPVLAFPPLFRLVVAVLTAGFWIGVVVGSITLQTFTARGVGSLETQRGVLDQRALGLVASASGT
jgi:glycosyltransferase involved in cell wall biosynthesis